ncbi:uncharacterized protein LOC127265101 [Andrographis paniculata]|uniref:uncharacterized protein LOC127265101 n=1 Tax=Andrographis paniculata TaxID=175694 RepID=UPI0021E6F89B|nr:uncharacterized protein LOC127265101 [Andrographis paniculata]
MAGAPPREQALPLLAAANNHADLAVKLSSLKQAKDILLSVEPSQAAELFPYLLDLQSSPETLVRKYLLEVIDGIGSKTREHLSMLLPVLLTFLRDSNPVIAKQSIAIGTKIFCIVLEELVYQFQRRGIVERWLEEVWAWMIKFKDAVLGIIFEVGAIGPKLLAIKFLETYVLLFTLESNDFGMRNPEGMSKQGRLFNVSWIMDGHPILDPPHLMSDANQYLAILLDMLQSANSLPGSLAIACVNSLAAIARKRPAYYKSVLAALFEFSPSLETAKGRHAVSIQYSLRTAFLGFLRCLHPVIAESRERLVKELRAMNAGDAADQVIRQTDKIIRNNERASREQQLNKDDHLSNQVYVSGDFTKKRPTPLDSEDKNNNFDATSKRFRYSHHDNTASANINAAGQDHPNGISSNISVMDGDLNPVEQMIAMIGALIAEGERGVKSLEILISNMHPDLLADIVMTNMKHLPTNPPNITKYIDPSIDPAQVSVSNGFSTSQAVDLSSQGPAYSANTSNFPISDSSTSPNPSTDSKRDPRRDPRRLDPRRNAAPADAPQLPLLEDNANPSLHKVVQSDVDATSPSGPLVLPPMPNISDRTSEFPTPTTQVDLKLSEFPVASEGDQSILKDEAQVIETNEFAPDKETDIHLPPPPIGKVEDTVPLASVNATVFDETYSPSSQEEDQLPQDISNAEGTESAPSDLPMLPQYISLDENQQRNVSRLALERIINSFQNSQRTDFKQVQIALVARLFGQTDINDVIGMVQNRVVSDYEQQKGHELIMRILYHLHSLVISDSQSNAALVYERLLLGVAKSLLINLPASDKSFSRLLGEVPCMPDSVLALLDDICTNSHSTTDGRGGDRVTQGLGAVWSLIMGRPPSRQACLNIALKCTIHPKDDVRAKSIRLVSNKLYSISYLSESIEQFATDKFISALDQRSAESLLSQSSDSDKRISGQVENMETSISGSQVSVPEISQNEASKSLQDASSNDSSVSSLQAYRIMSLYFALCTKKPILLQVVFENYARAINAAKQAVHRHITVLVRALGSSSSEVLHIISNPPVGSEDLLIQVLNVLSEGITPSPDLVGTVRQLYNSRLKDASILIPVLSAFSKDEVLPIFPQLVQLPLNKFQTALAHILQGSAHTGPALTPVEVLVAIHEISPERDGVPLKKITDACSACFEQRTVFTQQVLMKALSQMVDLTPLPLLYMRTVIQSIDAFPALVDFVMEILSKLVKRQIWRLPKLWVGFLKCISQTQPHSFRVLLQLPSPQLESALNKYPNLRGPLTAFANQSGAQTSLPKSTLDVLGMPTSSLRASDPNSSAHGATFT